MASESTSLGRFFRHSSIYAFGNVLNRIAALLLLPVYTNYLTVAEYGALELFYVVAAVMTGFLSVGIAHATLRFYFEYDAESDRNSVVTTNLTVSLLISLTGVSLVGLWHEELARHVFGGAEYGRGVQIILATLVLELSSQVSLAYLRAREYSALFVGIMFFKLLVQLAANTWFVVFRGMGVEGVLTGNLLAVAFGWVCLTVFVLVKCGYRFEWGKAAPALKYSFPFLLSTLTALVSNYTDRFLINSLLSLQLLGIYALALKFSELLESLIGEPFNRSYGAFRFSVMKQGDAAEIQARIVRYLLGGLAITGLGIVYFAADLLAVMSDPAFWPAAAILPILMLGSLLRVLAYPLQTGILYEKKTRHIFYIGVIAAVTSVTSNFILIRWWGLTGACFAQVLTAAVTLAVTDHISQRYFRVRYQYRRMLIIAAVTGCFYLASLPLGLLSAPAAFAAKVALYAVFVLAMFHSGALLADERLWLRAAVKRLSGRRGSGAGRDRKA